MHNLMSLYKHERTNDYFKDYAISQIKIAHRIKEYLDQDEYFPPKNISKSTMDLFQQRNVEEAVKQIFDEVSFYCSSSSGYENMQAEAVKFAEEMLDKYFDLQKHILLSEREKLLARLGEIDKEIAGEEEEKDIERILILH